MSKKLTLKFQKIKFEENFRRTYKNWSNFLFKKINKKAPQNKNRIVRKEQFF
jgi:hypothetical protein